MLQLLISVVALLVIALTMLMSASDLKLKGFRWNVRRVAFILAGVGAVALVYGQVFSRPVSQWYLVSLEVGVALMLMTNPFQRPWHTWIWKGSTGGVA